MPAPVIPNPLACSGHCSGTGCALPDPIGENGGGSAATGVGEGAGVDGEGAVCGVGRVACHGSKRHTTAMSERIHGSSSVSGAPAGACRHRSKTTCSAMPAPNAAVSEGIRTSREPVRASRRRRPPSAPRWRLVLERVQPRLVATVRAPAPRWRGFRRESSRCGASMAAFSRMSPLGDRAPCRAGVRGTRAGLRCESQADASRTGAAWYPNLTARRSVSVRPATGGARAREARVPECSRARRRRTPSSRRVGRSAAPHGRARRCAAGGRGSLRRWRSAMFRRGRRKPRRPAPAANSRHGPSASRDGARVRLDVHDHRGLARPAPDVAGLVIAPPLPRFDLSIDRHSRHQPVPAPERRGGDRGDGRGSRSGPFQIRNRLSRSETDAACQPDTVLGCRASALATFRPRGSSTRMSASSSRLPMRYCRAAPP